MAWALSGFVTGYTAEVEFSDDFKKELKPGWTWIREDKKSWRTTPEGLEIRVQRGNMWGPENSGKNVLVRDLPFPGRSHSPAFFHSAVPSGL